MAVDLGLFLTFFVVKWPCIYFARSRKTITFASQNTVTPIVQWIERRFPKPLIRVRFPVGVLPFTLLFYHLFISSDTDSTSQGVRICTHISPIEIVPSNYQTVLSAVFGSFRAYPKACKRNRPATLQTAKVRKT